MNSTVMFLEDKVRELTGAKEVVALNSGMAAISNTLLYMASVSKNIVSSYHLFGNSYWLLTSMLQRFGVTPRLCDLMDTKVVECLVDDDTYCIFLEIINLSD